jgi:3-hydroxy-9,10-secoandrosta-1,3,5(10)-triene-9,17-dione monooxygenase
MSAEPNLSAEHPTATREQLLANVAELLPTLRQRVAQSEANRCISAETIADFHDAGFFRMLQPRRWGGLEVHPSTFFDVQIQVATAHPSAAWVLGVVGVHNWQMALFDERAQEEVWGEDQRTLVSSSYAPTGKVTAAEGGFILNGRWSFSSGIDHCDWVFLGGFAPSPEGSPPDMRTYLIPRSDFEVEDNWHTIALRGTGSKDVILKDVFVPGYRTHKMSDGFRCSSPGNATNPAALYRLPFGQIFTRSVSTSAIGIAKGALSFYREVTSTKVGAADGNRAAKDPSSQMACARSSSAIDQLELVLHRDMNEMMSHAESGERMSIERRTAWRWGSSEAVSRAVSVVDELFSLCGARALFTSSPMHRYFVDVHGARAHYANRPDSSGRNFGRVQLGGRTQDYFI